MTGYLPCKKVRECGQEVIQEGWVWRGTAIGRLALEIIQESQRQGKCQPSTKNQTKNDDF